MLRDHDGTALNCHVQDAPNSLFASLTLTDEGATVTPAVSKRRDPTATSALARGLNRYGLTAPLAP